MRTQTSMLAFVVSALVVVAMASLVSLAATSGTAGAAMFRIAQPGEGAPDPCPLVEQPDGTVLHDCSLPCRIAAATNTDPVGTPPRVPSSCIEPCSEVARVDAATAAEALVLPSDCDWPCDAERVVTPRCSGPCPANLAGSIGVVQRQIPLPCPPFCEDALAHADRCGDRCGPFRVVCPAEGIAAPRSVTATAVTAAETTASDADSDDAGSDRRAEPAVGGWIPRDGPVGGFR